MTTKSVRVPVLNSLLLIRDEKERAVPPIDGRAGIWRTPSCIAVSCLPDSDGPSKITIGPIREIDPQRSLLFEGSLKTPSRRVVVQSVLGEEILAADVSAVQTRLKIWTNGELDTDTAGIGVESP